MTTHKNNQSTSRPAAAPSTLLQGPPDVVVPTVPNTFDPENAPATLSTLFPRQGELAALSAAITELEAFAEYGEVLGKTAPPFTQLVSALTAASQWSAMLVETRAFTAYVHAQTGVTWQATRVLLEGVKTPFQLASARDPSLASKFPALLRLLGAAQAVAAKSASTRKANQKAQANGEPEVHGKAGRRLKAAIKLVASTAQDPPATTTTSETAGGTPAATTTATHS
jgi:hypothetical protein